MKIMRFKIPVILFLSICSFLLLSPISVFAATYPNSQISVSPGQVIYSSKGWQTFFVGHVAIVGDDGKIYHSTPAVASGGVGETLSNYLSRFDSGTSFEVYAFRADEYGPFLEPYNAGKWARENVSKITEYSWANNLKMSNISSNYCSKFIWQAYYYGADTNLDRPYLGRYMTGSSTNIWTPADFKGSPVMKSIGTFTSS